MSRGLVTSSRYSPGNLTPEALVQTFVGRDTLMKDVVERVSRSIRGREKHFLLLVGPRGVGKTHFVSLLTHILSTTSALAEHRQRFVIASLNEEEWGVASCLDLIVRILAALPSDDTGSLSQELDRIHQTFQKDQGLANRQARKLLIDAVGKRTLVLICENLADLFDGLGERGQKEWRAFIQEHPFWTIVATSPSLSAGIRLQTSPFYGFFTIRELERLDLVGARQLLRSKARFERDHDMVRFLGSPMGRARVRAIHHLAGGNHRVYVIMSEFLTSESLDDLVGPFMRMVDDLTPYYQERMRQLSPLQRKIIEHLCRESAPATVKDIATKCLSSQQSVGKQIGELASLRFINRIPIGRESYCELAEPLMRICIEVKDNKTSHLRLFVQFLRNWFASSEIRTRAVEMGTEFEQRPFDRLHFLAAHTECEKDHREPFLDALIEEGLEALDRKDRHGAMASFEKVLAERPSVETYHVIVNALGKADLIDDAERIVNRGLQQYRRAWKLFDDLSAVKFHAGHFTEALAANDRARELRPDAESLLCGRGNILLRLRRYDEALDNERRLLAAHPEHWHSLLNKATALFALGDVAGAIEACNELLRLGHYVVEAAWFLARMLILRRQYDIALEALERGLARAKDNVRLMCLKGTLLFKLGRFEETIQWEEKVLERDPGHYHSVKQKAWALTKLRRFDDAVDTVMELARQRPHDVETVDVALEVFAEESSTDEAIARVDDLRRTGVPALMIAIAKARFLNDAGRWDDAVAILSPLAADPKVDEVFRETFARALLGADRAEEAASYAARSLETQPENWSLWLLRARAEVELGHLDEAVVCCRQFIEREAPAGAESEMTKGVELLLSSGATDAALRLSGYACHVAAESPDVWVVRGDALVRASSYDDAAVAYARARGLVPDLPGLVLKEAVASLIFEGQEAALSKLDGPLKRDPENRELFQVIATMLMIEASKHGVGAMATFFEKLHGRTRDVLPDAWFGSALTLFVGASARANVRFSGDWDEALGRLRRITASIEECRLPIKMLDVVVRYSHSHDERILLELSLEERQLLVGHGVREGVNESKRPVNRGGRSRAALP